MTKETPAPIDFQATAELRKWPSLNGQRVSEAVRPYQVFDGTLNECIDKLMAKPAASHHLYEIHTAPQTDVITGVLSPQHIVELARLRDFLAVLEISRGETLKLSGFGTFSVRQKHRRIGRNPKTGVEAPIEPRRVLVFKAPAILKTRVNLKQAVRGKPVEVRFE